MTQNIHRITETQKKAAPAFLCVSVALRSVFLCFGALCLCGFQAQINRPVVQESVRPGQTVNGKVEVENQGREPLKLQVYLEDWEYVEGGSGDKTFTAPGTSPWSASNWIHYFPATLELPSGGRGAVEYTVSVPPDAVGGHYAVLFFESFLAAGRNEAGVNVQYTGRLGSLFEIEAAGTVERTGEITDVTIGPIDPARPLTLRYTFRNTGNVAIRPKAYYNILNAQGRYLGRGEFNPLYTFPGRSGSVTTEWTGSLPPGDHTLLLTVDVGGGEPLVVERTLSASR